MKALLIGASMLAIAHAAPSVAQQAQGARATPAGVDAATAPTEGIADIIVTAQRRTENAQRAAIAIDVVSPAELRNAGVVTSSTLKRHRALADRHQGRWRQHQLFRARRRQLHRQRLCRSGDRLQL